MIAIYIDGQEDINLECTINKIYMLPTATAVVITSSLHVYFKLDAIFQTRTHIDIMVNGKYFCTCSNIGIKDVILSPDAWITSNSPITEPAKDFILEFTFSELILK